MCVSAASALDRAMGAEVSDDGREDTEDPDPEPAEPHQVYDPYRGAGNTPVGGISVVGSMVCR